MIIPAERSSYRLAGALALLVGVSYAFRVFDWGEGLIRGVLLIEMLTAMALLGRPTERAIVGRRLDLAVRCAIALGAALWLVAAVATVTKTAQTGVIPQDQGQTTYRSARMLLRGENPYGFGALVDFQGYFDRLAQREAAGLGPALPRAELAPALRAYDRDPNPAAKAALLPPAPPSGPGALEAELLGYKYGPLFLALALPLAAAGLPAGIMALNAVAAGLAVVVLGVTMRVRVGDSALARLGVAALLFDGAIRRNYVEQSATDVFALLFCALATLAALRGRPRSAAVALAFGFGFKIFPSALLFPMLLKGGRPGPALIFVSVAGAIYAPFALADFAGLMHNVFLWPAYLGADSTSWLAFAPAAVRPVVRGLGLAGMAFLWQRHLTGREPSLFRTLALVALLALVTSGAFHNNYLPWATIWMIAALVERFGPAFALRPQRPDASVPSLAPAEGVLT